MHNIDTIKTIFECKRVELSFGWYVLAVPGWVFDVELGVTSMLLMKCPWELHEVAPKMGAKIWIVTWKPGRGRGFVSFKEGCRIGEHDYLVDHA